MSASTDFRIIMPIYNEGYMLDEMLIKIQKVDIGILCKIFVIDDASTDCITAEILSSWRKKGLDVITVSPEEKKSPKRDAIIKAVRHLRETNQMPAKLIFTDGDTFFKAHESYRTLGEALEAAIKYKDQRSLTAISFPIVPIRRNFMTHIEELEFVLERTQRNLLNYVSISPVLSGGASIIDSSVYESLMNELIEGRDLADDVHITLLLQKEGYLTGYAPNFVVAFSDMPTTFSGLIKQRTRWFIAFFKSVYKEHRAILTQAIRLKPWALYYILAMLVLSWPSALLALAGITAFVPFSAKVIGIQVAAWSILIALIFLLTPERYQENRIKMLAYLPILVAYQFIYIPVVQILGFAGLLGANVNRVIDRYSSLWSSFIFVWYLFGLIVTTIIPLLANVQSLLKKVSNQKISLDLEALSIKPVNVKQTSPFTFTKSLLKQLGKQFFRLFIVLTICVLLVCDNFITPTGPIKPPSTPKERLKTVELPSEFASKLERTDNIRSDSSQTTKDQALWIACYEATVDYAVAYVDFFPYVDLTGSMEVVFHVRNTIPGIHFQIQLLPSRDKPYSPVGLSSVIGTLPKGTSTIRIPITEFGIDVSYIERLTIHHGRKNVLNQKLNSVTQTGVSSFLADNAITQSVVDIKSVECVQISGTRVLLTPGHLNRTSKEGELKYLIIYAFILVGVLLLLLYKVKNFIFK